MLGVIGVLVLAGDDAFRAVFPIVDDRPVSRHVSWYGPEGQVCCVVEAALIADFDSGIVLAGCAGFVLCFPSLSSGPRCAASWMDIFTARSWLLGRALVSGSHGPVPASPEAYWDWIFWEMT